MKSALVAKELIGKHLPEGYDWHEAFPVVDEEGLIQDIIDGEGYSHITGDIWDLTEYRWDGAAYAPVDLDALKIRPASKLWEDYVGSQPPVDFWQLVLSEDPSVTPEGTCMEYMDFYREQYPEHITPEESKVVARKLAEYMHEAMEEASIN